MGDILQIKDLHVSYTSMNVTTYAVNGLNISVKEGETLGLVGETGAGKTTTALSILGLLPQRTARVTKGEILYEGKDLLWVTEREMRGIRGEQISMVFQDPMTSLNPVLTVGDQLLESFTFHSKGMSQRAMGQKVDEMLELVGIPPERKTEYPHQFSGGMKQRIVIAMALACNPKLLIADEPTTALDVTIQAQVLSMMAELQKSRKTALLLITHDLGVIAQMCQRVAVMYAGEIVEEGTVQDIFGSKTHHPYTEGLFGSIPTLNRDEKRLRPIPGLMPDPTNLPEGCKFHLRCPKCQEICKREKPTAYVDGTHRINCFFAGGNHGRHNT